MREPQSILSHGIFDQYVRTTCHRYLEREMSPERITIIGGFHKPNHLTLIVADERQNREE